MSVLWVFGKAPTSQDFGTLAKNLKIPGLPRESEAINEKNNSRTCQDSGSLGNSQRPRTLGFCQKPQDPGTLRPDPGTLRPLMKNNIILENVWTLGLWESSSVLGLVQA